MRKLRTLIVEDKPKDLEKLQGFLSRHDHLLEIVAVAKSFEEALAIFTTNDDVRFDLSILDYKIGKKKTIFDVFNAVIDRNRFGIVGLTSIATEELFKKLITVQAPIPISKPHVQELIDVFMLRVMEQAQTLEKKLESIFLIYDGASYRQVKLRNICFIEADKNDSIFYCKNSSDQNKIDPHTHIRGLGEVMKTLDTDIFYRCHDSYIINYRVIVHCTRDGKKNARVWYTDSSDESTKHALASKPGREKLVSWKFME
jgi:DNA-binding LytR/AlgR family response regulator